MSWLSLNDPRPKAARGWCMIQTKRTRGGKRALQLHALEITYRTHVHLRSTAAITALRTSSSWSGATHYSHCDILAHLPLHPSLHQSLCHIIEGRSGSLSTLTRLELCYLRCSCLRCPASRSESHPSPCPLFASSSANLTTVASATSPSSSSSSSTPQWSSERCRPVGVETPPCKRRTIALWNQQTPVERVRMAKKEKIVIGATTRLANLLLLLPCCWLAAALEGGGTALLGPPNSAREMHIFAREIYVTFHVYFQTQSNVCASHRKQRT